MHDQICELGKTRIIAAGLAVDDINRWLIEEDKDWRFNLVIKDTEGDSSKALSLMQELHADGVDFFIGPLGSGAAFACLDYANNNEILYISPSATSPWLTHDDWFGR